jgi:histidinol-phosphatase (PHP family)
MRPPASTGWALPGTPFGNFHTHTRHCDGNFEPMDYAVAALRKGMPRIGFSGHNPVPFPTEWTMPEASLPSYLQTVRDAKARCAGRLEIYLGIEADYIPGVTSPDAPWIRDLGLDYVLGSVHFVAPLDGRYTWTVDGTPEEMESGLHGCFHGDVRSLVERYYALVAEMAEETRPDIIGHIDVVKKNNRRGRWFREDAWWYREAVLGALKAIRRSGSVMEINTGGIVRNTSGALYPSEWILREARALGIPVMVNADAHRPEHIDGWFAQAVQVLRDLGFTAIRQLTPDGWTDTAI